MHLPSIFCGMTQLEREAKMRMEMEVGKEMDKEENQPPTR